MAHAVASDHTVRLWNYETLKCEIVHNFRTDELFSVAIHPSGFRVLVGFKVRLYLGPYLTSYLGPYLAPYLGPYLFDAKVPS